RCRRRGLAATPAARRGLDVEQEHVGRTHHVECGGALIDRRRRRAPRDQIAEALVLALLGRARVFELVELERRLGGNTWKVTSRNIDAAESAATPITANRARRRC